MFNVVLARVDFFRIHVIETKLELTIKIFKDDKNLLANVTFPYNSYTGQVSMCESKTGPEIL